MPFISNGIYVEESSKSSAFSHAGHIDIEFIKVKDNVINELAKINNGISSLATYNAWNRGYFTKTHIYQFTESDTKSNIFKWSDINIETGTVTAKSVTLQATMSEYFAHKCVPIFNTSFVYYYDSGYLYKIDLNNATVTVLVSGIKYAGSGTLFYSSDKSHNLYLGLYSFESVTADIQKYNVNTNTMSSICKKSSYDSANIIDVIDDKRIIYNEYRNKYYDDYTQYQFFYIKTINSNGTINTNNEKYFPSSNLVNSLSEDYDAHLPARPFLKYPVFINIYDGVSEDDKHDHGDYHRYVYDDTHGLYVTSFADTLIKEYNDSIDMYILTDRGEYTYDKYMINEAILTSYSGNGEPHDYHNNIIPSWRDMSAGNSCMSVMYYNNKITNYLAIITYKEDN